MKIVMIEVPIRKGKGKAASVVMSSAQRRKLADISNLNTEETHQQQNLLSSSKEYAEKLQKAYSLFHFHLFVVIVAVKCFADLVCFIDFFFFFLQENMTLMKALAHRKYPSCFFFTVCWLVSLIFVFLFCVVASVR